MFLLQLEFEFDKSKDYIKRNVKHTFLMILSRKGSTNSVCFAILFEFESIFTNSEV